MIALTHDSISLRGAGIVTVSQQKKGARFTLDSLLLADFCRIKPKERILEPGAGTGIISILLARKFPKGLFYPVEIQTDLASLCYQNIRANDLAETVIVIERDIRFLKRSMLPGGFDAIVTNPPYTRLGTGKQSPIPGRLAARHEQTASLGKWLDLRYFLKNKGRYYMVFPAGRMAELVALMKVRKLEPKRMRFVHPSVGKPASLVLIEAVTSAGTGLEVLPPLVLHESGGGYSEEMRRIYGLSQEDNKSN